MARDRDRGKRRKRKNKGEDAADKAKHFAEGSTPTPDPLDHASAEVDEAKLAEAGATPPPMTEEDGDFGPEIERAPDEIEGDLVPDRGYVDEAAAEAAHERRQRGGVISFLGHVVDELKRVQWPDRRQVFQGTAVTLGFVVIAGGYLGLLDALWKPLIAKLI